MSSSRKRSLAEAAAAAAAAAPQADGQQRTTQSQMAAAARNSTAIVFVSRNVTEGGSNRQGGQVENVRPRPLPDHCEDDKRSFIQEFREHIVDLVKEFRRDVPYRQTIQWTMEYGDNNQHTLHINAKQPRWMRQHDPDH